METLTPHFTYRATCHRIVDGDTLDLELDLGFRLTKDIRIRLSHVDTAEIYSAPEGSEEYEQGKEHQDFVSSWIHNARDAWDEESPWYLTVATRRDRTGKYGRYLADVYRRDTGDGLVDALLKEFPKVAD